jgi:hypothetical protein
VEPLVGGCRPHTPFVLSSMATAITQTDDPLTGEVVSLFNPRTQQWSEHFTWSFDARKVEGLTAIGRVTVIALRMNNPVIVAARYRWAISGWHPPENN